MSDPARAAVQGKAGSLSYLSWTGPADGTPILFLHPVNTAAAAWEAVAAELAGQRPMVAVDYRGHGDSEPHGPYFPANYAADAASVLDALRIESAHVVCGSIGGAVAVELAAMSRGRVASITAFGATLRIGWPAEDLVATEADLRALGVRGWFAAHGAGILGPASRAEAAGRLVELAARGRRLDNVVEILRTTFGFADSRPAAALVEWNPPPARVFVGTHDPTCPPDMARELARYLHGELRTIPEIGHLPMLEDPPGTAAAVQEFLDEIERGGR